MVDVHTITEKKEICRDPVGIQHDDTESFVKTQTSYSVGKMGGCPGGGGGE